MYSYSTTSEQAQTGAARPPGFPVKYIIQTHIIFKYQYVFSIYIQKTFDNIVTIDYNILNKVADTIASPIRFRRV